MQLIIDTTSSNLFIAIKEKDKKPIIYFEDCKNRQSDKALPVLEELLEQNKLKLRDLTEVYVGHGPGSYTGVRVGLSIAKTLCILNPMIKAVGFNSMFLMNGDGKKISFRDARSKKLYVLKSNEAKVEYEGLIDADQKENFIESNPDFEVCTDFDIESFFRIYELFEEDILQANYLKEANAIKQSR